MKDKLRATIGEIERAHRLASERSGSSRLIIVKYLNSTSEDKVLRNALKLKKKRNLETPGCTSWVTSQRKYGMQREGGEIMAHNFVRKTFVTKCRSINCALEMKKKKIRNTFY